MQHQPRAAEKEAPSASSETEKKVNLHAYSDRDSPMRARALSTHSCLEYLRVLYSLTV